MKDIGLQDLIYQVKRELLAPNPAEQSRDPSPLFLVDKVELEISVKVSQEKDGSVKLTVLDFAEISAGSSRGQEQGHIVKVTLSPVLSREKILEEALKDKRVLQTVQRELAQAFVKGANGLAGEPE